MQVHGSDGIDLDGLLTSVRDVANEIIRKRWHAYLPPGPIETAREYLEGRVRAAIARVADFTEFLKAVSDLEQEMAQAQRNAAHEGRWYFDVLRRLDPDYAEALRQKLDSEVVVPVPKPEDEEQPDSEGPVLGDLSVREALLLMLALADGPMLPSEIIGGLVARGKRIDGNDLSQALQDCEAKGEIVSVPAKPGPGIKLKWTLSIRG